MKFKLNNNGVSLYTKVLAHRVQYVTEAVAERFVDNARDNTPVDTGRLRAGYKVNKTDTGVTVTNDVPYLPYVNFGTSNRKGQHFIEKSYEQTLSDLDKIADDSQNINK